MKFLYCTSQDLIQYVCFADNEVGTDLGRIPLRQQNRINLLDVVAAAFDVAVLIAIAIHQTSPIPKGRFGEWP